MTVTTTTIDWLLPAGPPDGCINTGTGTAVLFGPTLSSTLGPGVAGRIMDLTIGGGVVPDFMTFVVGADTLHFDLIGIGPGVTGPNAANCANALNPNLASCSVVAGSPFVLTPNGGGTSVGLSAFGIAHDNLSGGSSPWIGAFTTQIAGETPAAIQASFLANGTITNTFSGAFTLTTVPEPLSMALIGGGLMGLALLRRRKRQV